MIGFPIPISQEMLDDIPQPLTSEELMADDERYQDLKARGLLADDGIEIGPNDCPAVYYAGHDGDETFYCELSRGHGPDHSFCVTW